MCVSVGHHQLAVEPHCCSYSITDGVCVCGSYVFRSYEDPDGVRVVIAHLHGLELPGRHSDDLPMLRVSANEFASGLCRVNGYRMQQRQWLCDDAGFEWKRPAGNDIFPNICSQLLANGLAAIRQPPVEVHPFSNICTHEADDTTSI